MIIDCDVHQTWANGNEITKRLPAYFRQGFYSMPSGNWQSPIGVNRKDAKPDLGEAGSDPNLLRAQLLDRFGISKVVLTGSGILGLGVHANVDYANALARAYNDALIETWMTWDQRFFGSVIINPQDPRAAAAEIRRVGGQDRIVQILMCSGTRTPYGQRQYWPIYEAACELGLPVAVHPGTEGRGIANGFIAGPPSTYFEWHSNLPQNYMGHIVSLVCEGVFEQFPSLKFVAIEGGLAWIPGVLWRLDKNWKALRATTPWLKRLPSETIVEHIRFTTQPIEEPALPRHFLGLLEMIHAEKTLMFSSDYPHWDNDSPEHLFPASISAELRERIFFRNAEEWYRFTPIPAAQP
jgi:predicted TIM-barrel fold metal-dependent hydrolase